jgi:hypothetical protein
VDGLLAPLGVIGLVVSIIVAVVLASAVLVALRSLLGGPVKVRADEYMREPDTRVPPAVVEAILHGAAGPDAVVATLLDLAQRGEIEVREGRKKGSDPQGTAPGEAVLIRNHDRDTPDRMFERTLTSFVFHTVGRDRTRVSARELRRWTIAHRHQTSDWYALWRQHVLEAAVEAGLLRRGTVAWRITAGMAAATCLVTAVLFAKTLAMPTLLALGLVGIYAALHISWLTPRGVQVRAEYGRLRNYLQDFGRLEEKPADAVAVWGVYLPYAVVLGEGERALRDLDFIPAIRVETPAEQDRTTQPVIRPGMLLGDGDGPADAAGRQAIMEDYLLAGRRTRP